MKKSELRKDWRERRLKPVMGSMTGQGCHGRHTRAMKSLVRNFTPAALLDGMARALEDFGEKELVNSDFQWITGWASDIREAQKRLSKERGD